MRMLYISLGIIGMSISVAGAASAATLVASGYEQPEFNPGALNGQNGITASAQFTVGDTAGLAHSGSQYVDVASGESNAQTLFPRDSTGSTVDLDGWFFVGAGNQWVDIQLKFSSSVAVAVGFQSGNNGFTNDVVYRDRTVADGGTGAYVALGKYTPDTWINLNVALDTVGSLYDVTVNGTQVGDNLLTRNSGVTAVDRMTFDQQPGSGVFRFDDVAVGDPIPEPTSGALAAGILSYLTFRRRNR